MIIVQAKAIPKNKAASYKIVAYAENLIKNTKLEDGNLSYNLYMSTQDDSLMFIELWDDMDSLQLHLNTAHFNKFDDDIKDLLSEELIIEVYNADETQL